MKVKIVNRSKHALPGYSTEASAGMDLRANLETNIILEPLGRVMDTSRGSGGFGHTGKH